MSYESLRAALVQIASFNDRGANERLAARGDYGAFDEPGSVEIAREALAADDGIIGVGPWERDKQMIERIAAEQQKPAA